MNLNHAVGEEHLERLPVVQHIVDGSQDQPAVFGFLVVLHPLKHVHDGCHHLPAVPESVIQALLERIIV